MPGSKQWLTPNLMSEADKARAAQIAKERNMSLDDVMQMLEAEQSKAKAAPRPHEPKVIAEKPEPRLIAERPTPRAVGEPAAPSPNTNQSPDPQLLELVRLYNRLGERDRLELVMLARVKVHLNERAG